jgi:hypothetical protein
MLAVTQEEPYMVAAKHGVAVSVAGMPSSGNRIFQRILAAHGVPAAVDHFGNCEGAIKKFRSRGLRTFVLVPIREANVHLAGSYDKYIERFKRPYEEQRNRHHLLTIEAASRFRVPIIPVRYRAFVNDPETVCRELFQILGVPFVQLPEEVVDGDAKWLAKAKSETT